MDFGIIGGADGPAVVFVTASQSSFNSTGLFFVLLLLLPNLLFARKLPKQKPAGKLLTILEQAGRYACILLMVTGLGIFDFRIPSLSAILVYHIGNAILILLYWIFWLLFLRKQTHFTAMMLAVLPGCVFLLSGITLRVPVLTAAAVLFLAAHTQITRHRFH